MKQRSIVNRRLAGVLMPVAFGLAMQSGAAFAEDLLQIYRDAVRNDPALASAQANWEATQELVPQARAGLLPNVAITGDATAQRYQASINTDPRQDLTRRYNQK